MDTPFIYDRYVTGRNFIGRKAECNTLAGLLGKSENVVLIEPPKSGKMSVIQQTMFNMKASGQSFSTCCISLFNTRGTLPFLVRFGTAVIRANSSTSAEYEKTISELLDGSGFVFDRENFSDKNEILTFRGEEITDSCIDKILRLPYRIAETKGERLLVIVEEFQNLLFSDDCERIFGILRSIFGEYRDTRLCSFILTGSRVNAMKHIFTGKKYFYRTVEHLPLHPVDDRDIMEYITKGFLMGGKVVENDLVLGACRLFRNNLWYLNHFISICDSMTKGYINEGVLTEALRIMLSVHWPRFSSAIDSLTGHQISFLNALMHGETRLSAAEVITKYGLHSSANVRRVKDALCKKEIITFDSQDEFRILDPLFEYWIGKYYFELY